MARTQGVGILRPELAVNAGVTGPMLRASGVNYDIRKVDKYGIYNRFNVPRAAGRALGRLRPLHDPAAGDAGVAQILEQALKEIPLAGDGSQGEDFAASGPSRARRTGGLKRPRESWAFI
jgi:NADH-quinone oxidoreductase subunit D